MFLNFLKELSSLFSSFFDFLKTSKKNQLKTQIIQDKKRLEKASNIAEDIFFLIDKNINLFDEKTIKRYEKLKREFNRKD